MSRALEYLHEFTESNVALHGNDVGARNHDIHDAPFAQTEDVLEHDALGRGKAGLARAVLEHIPQVGTDRARFPAEHRPQRASEPALSGLAGGWARSWHQRGQIVRRAGLV